ncbi:MAG: hypothetical protein ACD_16C00194G0003 [uncultured bacterium]|nr:MAG: hypothetical protein ACD_16C00194G0003 [uncultured bacterium]OFW69040.1 MAG: hypothetical protein A2X70_00625 [Alphaproteobacteria bacterium GWC2_42_16]OFW82217.1 MAG: hypothetical protein A3E50_04545 [Alphaproteobacteria bacterium RIFCSPHIGHO2_12_FULL_42_100]OFW86459.1 MAG: hypothetical protein A2W06_00340 [Alphaproteobacteria bacterium RBG_16_42_14]OFW91383.1 MAG: hypothetical protein A3C41_06835 [Alphaproteobacteria bacterium RIFCSPHIGHO2_02_FULL_42_30]OFW93723.1 MAG: hypothetical p
MSLNTIAYVGLTHLGLISAAAALEKGFKVICFDRNQELVANLKSGKYPINEPGFKEAMEKRKDRVYFTSCPEDLKKAELLYVAPDIPTNDSGVSDLQGIKELISFIIPSLSKSSCLIVLSQVPPGFTRALSQEIQEPLRVYYQVETLVFGIAMQRALYPERFIVGTQNKNIPLDPNFETFLKAFNCPILVMDYESAEFCKICINAFLAATVSTTNTLEEICQKIGAKWRDIVPALRLDKRIGEYAYLAPGLGLSGGNIERDLKTITSLAQCHGSHGQVVDSFIKNSQHRRNWPLNTFYKKVYPQFSEKPLTLCVLGIAYKENTHSTKNSASLRLLAQLKNFEIQAYDPLVKSLPFEHGSITIKDSALEAVKGADVLFLMTPWDEFKDLQLEDLLSIMRERFIIDPYKILSMDSDVAFKQNVTYYSLC